MPQDAPIQFRDRELEAQIEARTPRSESRNQTAKRDLERYYAMIAAEDVVLDPQNAIVLWNALNGVNRSHAEVLMILKQGVASELREDGNIALADLVKGWSAAQWLNVIDKVDRVGLGQYSIEDMNAELVKVGLSDGFS